VSEVAKLLLGPMLIAVCCGAAVAQQTQRPAEPERAAPPYEITRAMEAVQDQVVKGDAEARARLPKLVSQIADRLLTADPALWRDSRNARAAIIYTLSGGQPRVVRKILETASPPEAEATMMAGVLAYVEGRQAKAKQMLMPIDALTVAPALGGYIAFTQSALIAGEDPGRAARLLDEARVLAPGTLIEEAALRRSMFLADEMQDLDRFIASSSQYIRRYRRSLYADNFRDRFANSAVHFGLVVAPAQREKLASLLSELESPDQLGLYLLMAQAGILKGKIEPAAFAAGQAMRLSRETGLEADRARLYELTTKILAREQEAGLSELATIDSSRLARRDVELKDIVAKMAAQIQKGVPDKKDAGVARQAGGQAKSSGKNDESTAPSVLMESAQLALDQADALLKRAEP
jgi:chemotaxis protein MotC